LATKAQGGFSHKPRQSQRYAAQMYDLLQGLGINSLSRASAQCTKPDIDWAESEQKRLGIQESGYILIHAGSSQLAQAKSIDKIYPVENWQQLSKTSSSDSRIYQW